MEVYSGYSPFLMSTPGECVPILADRGITFQDVIDQVFQLFAFTCTPQYIRSDTVLNSQRERYTVG